MDYTHVNALNEIKYKLKVGAITYDQAKERAVPHIKAMNDKAQEIAKRHGVKPKKITFAGFMR